jgi:hypothetical protein
MAKIRRSKTNTKYFMDIPLAKEGEDVIAKKYKRVLEGNNEKQNSSSDDSVIL